MNQIPKSIKVTIKDADICLTAFLKYFSSQGQMSDKTSVIFDFEQDANEYKQALIEEFGIIPADIETVIRFK